MRTKNAVIAAIERARKAGITYKRLANETGADYEAIQKAEKRNALASEWITLVEPWLEARGYFSPQLTADEIPKIAIRSKGSDIFEELAARLNNAAVTAMSSKLDKIEKAKAVKQDWQRGA